MPKRKDIKKILVVGAGPIIIGQAGEFDYSGTQACKALKDEGFKIILINSNPATIMTDPNIADKTYSWKGFKTWRKKTGYKKNNKKIFKIVAIDYGIKKNILRYFSDYNCDVKVV